MVDAQQRKHKHAVTSTVQRGLEVSYSPTQTKNNHDQITKAHKKMQQYTENEPKKAADRGRDPK